MQSVKPIRIAVPTVLGELRFRHTTSTSSGIGWVGVSVLKKCPAVVPWATADGESGSIKTWILCVGSTSLITWLVKNHFEKTLFKNKPLHV